MNKREARYRVKNFDALVKNRNGPYHVVLKSVICNLYMRLFPNIMVSSCEEAYMYEYGQHMLRDRVSALKHNNLKIVLTTDAGDIDIQFEDLNG